MSQRKAADCFDIPRRTLINKLNSCPGFPQIFTDDKEAKFMRCVIEMCDYGFPVTSLELQMLVKSYLARLGTNVPRFIDKCPGHELVFSFCKRHPELTVH
ncbi:hypothetical protein PR048_013884 [Dryococelus australis]|uniref:HTH psq-type domain-containing protein n=1 Tax=Dryococelus australis TaxID=614101 RepID=A0ABQ9HTI9_9NEOP|nr:hypothetical protein PR048_013884 [Dryococelus australis]